MLYGIKNDIITKEMIELNIKRTISKKYVKQRVTKKLKFYSWFNLWFNTFEIISKFVLSHNCFGDKKNIETNIKNSITIGRPIIVVKNLFKFITHF